MNEEIKDQWVSALQSAEYEKADGVLHEVETGHMCANGVLCDLAYRAGVVERQKVSVRDGWNLYVYGEDQLAGMIPHEVRKWAGLSVGDPTLRYRDAHYDHMHTISQLNDGTNLTLAEIGVLIKEQL